MKKNFKFLTTIAALVLVMSTHFSKSLAMPGNSTVHYSNAGLLHNYPNDDRGGEQGRNYRHGNSITYEWKYIDKYLGIEHNMAFQLDLGWNFDKMQANYRSKNHQHGNYNRFIQDDTYIHLLKIVANHLRKVAKEQYLNEVTVALSFVQSLPYAPNMGNYQRYCVETLIDGRGDCSDTSVLFAAFLWYWGYDGVFLEFPGHLAVGVTTDGFGECYYPIWGRDYFYCETTGSGWAIGQCVNDDDLNLQKAVVTSIY